MYTVYALRFSDNRVYVGFTNNIHRRMLEHKQGKTKSTKNRGAFTLFELEQCADRVTARAREKYWKSGYGKEQLKLRTGSSAG
jgi:putative endonuclease